MSLTFSFDSFITLGLTAQQPKTQLEKQLQLFVLGGAQRPSGKQRLYLAQSEGPGLLEGNWHSNKYHTKCVSTMSVTDGKPKHTGWTDGCADRQTDL